MTQMTELVDKDIETSLTSPYSQERIKKHEHVK